MSGSGGISMARPARGENRFYISPAMRKYQPQQQQQQQQKPATSAPRIEAAKKTAIEVDPCESYSSTSSSSNSTISYGAGKEEVPVSRPFGSAGNPSFTNLDRFLDFTAPVVPAQILPKSAKGWRGHDTMQPLASPLSFFVLGDLWESFKEWSVYGAGVPVLLNGCDTVVQYYVPYLSGMQLYVDSSKHSSMLRRPGDDSDADSSRSISTDGASDYESDSGANDAIGNFRSSYQNTHDASSDECEMSTQQGKLVFEYLEHASPFTREPLADKASALASQFPQLKSYRSCDLAPSSWMSVAWYPIYRIPMGPTLQNLDACFLTFHSLSTPSHGNNMDGTHDLSKLRLPTFGLASYKCKVSFWNPDDAYENQKVNSLLQAADNWLKLLQVIHPDYRFFTSHGSIWK